MLFKFKSHHLEAERLLRRLADENRGVPPYARRPLELAPSERDILAKVGLNRTHGPIIWGEIGRIEDELAARAMALPREQLEAARSELVDAEATLARLANERDRIDDEMRATRETHQCFAKRVADAEASRAKLRGLLPRSMATEIQEAIALAKREGDESKLERISAETDELFETVVKHSDWFERFNPAAPVVDEVTA
jgi:hypothetical protein